jgi:hypothetical protein
MALVIWFKAMLAPPEREACPCTVEHCEREAMGDPEGRCPGVSCAWR